MNASQISINTIYNNCKELQRKNYTLTISEASNYIALLLKIHKNFRILSLENE